MKRLTAVPKSREQWKEATRDADADKLLEVVWPKIRSLLEAVERLMNELHPEPRPLTWERHCFRKGLTDRLLGELGEEGLFK